MYILSGAPGCGKTTLLNAIAALTRESVDPRLIARIEGEKIDPITKAVRAPKFSERDIRPEDGAIIDDIITEKPITLERFDLAYVRNGIRYGLRFECIHRLLEQGLNCLVIVSDLRAIRKLKQSFGDIAQAIYISSAIDPDRLRRIQLERWGFRPDENQKAILSHHFARLNAAGRLGWWDRVSEGVSELEKDWHSYATDEKSTQIRIQRIRSMHIRFVEHIGLFDNVILNYSEGRPEEMCVQMRNVIRADVQMCTSYESKKDPPIFVVAAASGSGKGTLMEMLNLIGSDRIKIVSKLATRTPRPEDRRDGMIALTRNKSDSVPKWPSWWSEDMKELAMKGRFPEEYDLRWIFDIREKIKLEFGAKKSDTTFYAVSSREIEQNLRDGKPQIFVSNTGQFYRFREMWPDKVVFLYLHRLATDQENRQFQMVKWKDKPMEAEARIKEKDLVHQEYIRRIAEFDHVLLNTSFPEDLYDQMFHLIRLYGRN